jgi:hypothetical protein
MVADTDFQLKYYYKVTSKKVDWLWYPYIPYGKITIVQGDPGDGKSAFLLNLAALLTLGKSLPGNAEEQEPMTVIYQNAEDGIEDTIKPRLENIGADCSRVAYLDGDGRSFSACDESIERAIVRSHARLLVLDPIQAFIGDADMNRANDIRVIMTKLADIADKTGCAIVLVGHMNKNSGGKGLYRGLGSIDFTAAARSVLLVGRVKDAPNVRAVVHIKSNLAPEGGAVVFELSEGNCFRWIDGFSITQEELLGESVKTDDGKFIEACKLLSDLMGDGKKLASECYAKCKQQGIGTRTFEHAKATLGIKSERKQEKWYWALPNNGGEND